MIELEIVSVTSPEPSEVVTVAGTVVVEATEDGGRVVVSIRVAVVD